MKGKKTYTADGVGAVFACDGDWSHMTDLWFELDALSAKCAGLCGLSETGYCILCNLLEYGQGRTQTEIYKSDILNKQTVNSGVKQLIAENVLRAEAHGREKKLFLTEKGKRLMEERVIPLVQIDNDAFCAIPRAERERFISILGAYFENRLAAFAAAKTKEKERI